MAGCGVHATDPVESGDGKHDKRSRTRFDAMRRHKVDRTGGTICSSLIDDQFPTPIRLPFFMEIGDDRDPALWRSTSLYEPTLIRIIMSQETVPGGIRIVIESHMTPDDVRERLDMISNAGEL